ncbi:Aaa-atpase [Quillaja saponaria]|uniref:Aaa-atpase n=1 Tax=Quillaja saponaria TaxID=32244 RepID=A0AAD7L7T4_QUISA|nr:Aaa-atpase [Quillaja saponaria]
MFSLNEMPSTTALFSAYASFTASMMLVRSMADQLIPHPLRSYLTSALHYLFTPLSSNLTIVIDEKCGMTSNQVYNAAEVYLRTKISPSTQRLRVSKTQRQKNITVTIHKDEEINDKFDNFLLKWRFLCTESEHRQERRSFELTFHKKFKEQVLESYLPYVLLRAKEIKESDKVVKIYNRARPYYSDEEGQGDWGSINLEHPSTFDTLAMDPDLKKTIKDDLDRFVRRRDFYKKVGKAWKRGYLLYGPPGTGKSSLIAAMANYLKFDIYDLELSSIYSDSELRWILLSTANRSILVIEDIDCSVEMQDRENQNQHDPDSHTKLTLSSLLNFIDGLWSSCGDERIIVFTTNHKEKLDPALLRPGRMDVHINMSYCSGNGFKILASNYLGIHDHCQNQLYEEVQGLIDSTEVTPAEVAEELMKSDDADVALEGLARFLKRKKIEENTVKDKGGDQIEVQEAKRLKT